MKKFPALLFLLIFVISLVGPATSVQASGLLLPSEDVDASYEVQVSLDPEPSISIRATFEHVSSPFTLEISYPEYDSPNLSIIKDLVFSSPNGTSLSYQKKDSHNLLVTPSSDTVVATYSIDISQPLDRQVKVSNIGGILSGYAAFLVPSTQTLASSRVKFILPKPWTVVSAYPMQGEWFTIQKSTYQDLRLETKSSGWFFGNVDFDQTFTYDDGFPIRVVGFKYFDYEHWNVYDDYTSLEGAKKTADLYFATIKALKKIMGEYPLPSLTLVGPGYFQAGKSFLTQQLVGWYRYEYIPHHLVHVYFGGEGSRIMFSGRSYSIFGEGFTTYSEGILTSQITGDPIWRGMLFERKLHYLRGKTFNNLQQNSGSYVIGFIVTYLMDKEINRQTNGEKGIYDLMKVLWDKYSTSTIAEISDDQLLDTLKELTGNDWQEFYQRNIANSNNLDVSQIDDLKDNFRTFLKVESDTWFDGYPSAYFLSLEILASAGDFDMNCRMQNPLSYSPNISDFVIAAHRLMSSTHSDLTQEDIINILHQITGKDHSDFFDFYANQGFPISLDEINTYIKTFTYKDISGDNAIRFTPSTISLGESTLVVGEIIDHDYFANQLLLQMNVYDPPIGIGNIKSMVSGPNVNYLWNNDFSSGNNLSGTQYFFSLPKIQIGDKFYTFFKLSMPSDAGVIQYSIIAKSAEPTTDNWLGGFIGTQKVQFQDNLTFHFLPNGSFLKDTTPPIFSISTPDSKESSTTKNNYCVLGKVEPGATITINGEKADITKETFVFRSCLALQPGKNTIKVEARDAAGNISSDQVTIYLQTATMALSPTITATTQPSIKVGTRQNEYLIIFLTVSVICIAVVGIIFKIKKR